MHAEQTARRAAPRLGRRPESRYPEGLPAQAVGADRSGGAQLWPHSSSSGIPWKK